MLGLGLGIGVARFGVMEDIIAPILLVAEVGTVGDDTITLLYNEDLDPLSISSVLDYSVVGTILTVNSVGVDGRYIIIEMTGNITEIDAITIFYTAAADPVRDLSGNEAANLVAQEVTNNTQNYLMDHDGAYILDHDGDKIPI